MFNLISFFYFQIIKIVCLVLKGGAFFERERGAGHIVENQNSPWRPFRQGNSQLVDTQSYIRGTSPLYRTAKMKSQNKTKIKFNRIIITENGWDFAFLACCSLELDPSQEMFKWFLYFWFRDSLNHTDHLSASNYFFFLKWCLHSLGGGGGKDQVKGWGKVGCKRVKTNVKEKPETRLAKQKLWKDSHSWEKSAPPTSPHPPIQKSFHSIITFCLCAPQILTRIKKKRKKQFN